MVGYSWLVKPLEAEFQARLEGVARRRGLPGGDDVAGLAEAVRALSGLYNQTASAGEHGVAVAARAHLRARLAFSFPRDVPKGAAAVRGARGDGAPCGWAKARRVCSQRLGAGMGAMTFGLARALAAAGERGALDVVYTDADERVLGIATSSPRPRRGTRAATAGAHGSLGGRRETPQGTVRCDPRRSGAERARRVGQRRPRVWRRTSPCAELFSVLAPSGALVIVEPALRDRTRHLHALRDAWLARGRRVFAPCLHGAACPALALAGLVPRGFAGGPAAVARARCAGRWVRAGRGSPETPCVAQGLGLVLADDLPAAGLRVVSSLLRTGRGSWRRFSAASSPWGPAVGAFAGWIGTPPPPTRRGTGSRRARSSRAPRRGRGPRQASTTVRVVAETR